MHMGEPDLLSQYEHLSKCCERMFNLKSEFTEAHNIYLELKEIRQKLVEVEDSFPKLNQY